VQWRISLLVGGALLKWAKSFLPWNPMKIGDPIRIVFIKSHLKFQAKKLTIRSPFGRKTAGKVVLPVKCCQAPNVKCYTMGHIAKRVTRIVVCAHLMVLIKLC
jgi:hypothetical protein